MMCVARVWVMMLLLITTTADAFHSLSMRHVSTLFHVKNSTPHLWNVIEMARVLDMIGTTRIHHVSFDPSTREHCQEGRPASFYNQLVEVVNAKDLTRNILDYLTNRRNQLLKASLQLCFDAWEALLPMAAFVMTRPATQKHRLLVACAGLVAVLCLVQWNMKKCIMESHNEWHDQVIRRMHRLVVTHHVMAAHCKLLGVKNSEEYFFCISP